MVRAYLYLTRGAMRAMAGSGKSEPVVAAMRAKGKIAMEGLVYVTAQQKPMEKTDH